MKRFHVNVAVKSIDDSVEFYNKLFNLKPSVVKHNYAKWELTDPAVNFSIVDGDGIYGVDHLGIQYDSQDGVDEAIDVLKGSKYEYEVQASIECCYSKSSKVWANDPQNVRWEQFVTSGSSEKFSGKTEIDNENNKDNDKEESKLKVSQSDKCCR